MFRSATATPPKRHRVASLVGLALLAACGGRPDVEGTIIDPWDKPVEGATVIMEGVVERQVTDAAGHFEFDSRDVQMNLLAGKDGYIKGVASVAPPPEDADELPPVQIVLYPDPPEPGFYAIGTETYVQLRTETAEAIGTELETYTGISGVGTAQVPAGKPLRLVFSTGLRPHEISRLDLRLHRLNFIGHKVIKGALGDTEATVNLFVADGNVPFDLVGLQTRNDYLITSREPMTTGFYAFDIEGVLSAHDHALLDHLPRELRVAYPYEVP